MSKNKLYFKPCEDICYDLEHHITDAIQDELDEIELYGAIPDKHTKDVRYCVFHAECVESSFCKKSQCKDYEPNKSGRGTCKHRGKLYLHGEKVNFKVDYEMQGKEEMGN
jgi:hypothetical protein